MAMFDPSQLKALADALGATGPSVLAQFKAGKMALKDRELKPDPRKGLLRVIRDADDLIHLQWCERETSTAQDEPDDDIVLFPGEAELKKVASAQRVYVLQFQEDSSRDMFFWMQETKADKDDEFCCQLNTAINSPGVAAAETEDEEMDTGLTASAAAGPVAGGSGERELMAAQLAQMLSSIASGQGPSMSTQNQAKLGASLLASAFQGYQRQAHNPGPGLAEILTPEVLVRLLSDPEMLERLSPYLPEEHRTQGALLELAKKDQFTRQLKTFSMALQTGQLDLEQLGLEAKGFSVVDFLNSIQELVDRQSKEQKEKTKEQEHGS